MKVKSESLLCGIAALVAAFSAAAATVPADAIDADAAVKLAKSSHCLRCHGVVKKKEGPSYAVLAARYKGKPDAEEKLLRHITSGEKVELTDGHKENHKAILNKSPDELRNLVKWILAQ